VQIFVDSQAVLPVATHTV